MATNGKEDDEIPPPQRPPSPPLHTTYAARAIHVRPTRYALPRARFSTVPCIVNTGFIICLA